MSKRIVRRCKGPAYTTDYRYKPDQNRFAPMKDKSTGRPEGPCLHPKSPTWFPVQQLRRLVLDSVVPLRGKSGDIAGAGRGFHRRPAGLQGLKAGAVAKHRWR